MRLSGLVVERWPLMRRYQVRVPPMENATGQFKDYGRLEGFLRFSWFSPERFSWGMTVVR